MTRIILPEHCEEIFNSLKNKIKNIEKLTKGKVVFFDGDLTPRSAFYLHKVIRRLKGKELFLILESPGGEIDTAAKIVHMCKQYFNKFNVIVPSYAKSAATLICIAADNLFIGKAGEIGPIDPQVRHPIDKEVYFPALSIKDAIEFIEDTKDPFVKIGLTEKIDPYLMGAYKRVLKLAEQYIKDANLVKNSKKSQEIITSLTQKYISHGYPIDIEECQKLDIKLSNFKENKVMYEIYNFFEEYVDFRIGDGDQMSMGTIILSSEFDVKEIKFKLPAIDKKQAEELLKPKKQIKR